MDAAVQLRLGEQLLQELPQMDVRAAPDWGSALLLICGQIDRDKSVSRVARQHEGKLYIF